MTWASVLAVLVKLFGPLLVEWLKKLLEDAAREMAVPPSRFSGTFEVDLADLFARARDGLWWFQFRKVAALRLAERAAAKRADEIRWAALGRLGPVPTLTGGERAELRAALA